MEREWKGSGALLTNMIVANTLPHNCFAGAMKGMKGMPKGGGKGGRMPQVNMDPAQMVRRCRQAAMLVPAPFTFLIVDAVETPVIVRLNHLRLRRAACQLQAKMLPPHMLQQVSACWHVAVFDGFCWCTRCWCCLNSSLMQIELTFAPVWSADGRSAGASGGMQCRAVQSCNISLHTGERDCRCLDIDFLVCNLCSK